jgi:hypothetical protein
MRFRFWIGLLFTFCLFLTACNKEQRILNLSSYADYLPLHYGKLMNYRIDSFQFKVLQSGISIDTVSWVEKHQIVQADSLDNEIKAWYSVESKNRIDGLKRESQFLRVFDFHHVHLHQHNRILAELVLHPTMNRSWDPLAHFDQLNYIEIIRDEPIRPFKHWQRAVIRSLSDTMTISDVFYSDLLRVVYVDHENALEKRYAASWFAKGIGLVYSESWILDTQRINSIEWNKKAEKGYITRKYFLSLE